MALFRLPTNGPAALVPRGHGLLLRAPQMSDYPQWAQLREYSRAYLTPWEPIWPSDDLTRAGFRRRLRRYAEDIAADRSYPFIIFRESDGAMIGGVTLANVRRGIVQAGTIGYWVGQPHAGRSYMTTALRVLLPSLFGELNLHRIEAACIPSNAASIRVLEKCGFTREGWRGATSASTGFGRTTCCSACCMRIFGVRFYARRVLAPRLLVPWARRHCAAIRPPAGDVYGRECKGPSMGDKPVIRGALCRRGLDCDRLQPVRRTGGLAIHHRSFQEPVRRWTAARPTHRPRLLQRTRADKSDLTCPPVAIRAGASTFAVAAPGKQAVGNDLSLSRRRSPGRRANASINAGQITARIGIQGRVIAGPSGAPQSVQVPLRVAVVQAGVGEKVIATKAYQTTVTMGEEYQRSFFHRGR